MKIDLNCDLGEGFGQYKLGNDEALMPLITSANIACGFHAGDAQVMSRTVHLAVKAGVAIGAHPGYPDLQGFGRRSMDLTMEEIENMVLYQVGALAAFARAAGAKPVHVKPHGALYNRASVDHACALAIARAVAGFDPALILVGLAGSKLIEAGNEIGLRTANEGFPDRTYLPDSNLMPRSWEGAILENPEKVAENAVRLASEGICIEKDGKIACQRLDTLCLHGDNPSAVENARLVSERLKQAGFKLAALV